MQGSTCGSSPKAKDRAKDGSCYARVLPVEKSYQDEGCPEEQLPLPTSVCFPLAQGACTLILYYNPLDYVIIKSM